VDERVDKDKHPDRRGHVTDASPHAQHGACVVVGLESCASLALCDNDHGVDNLVELGEVEEPAPEGKALVPEAANVGGVRSALWHQLDHSVFGLPDIGGRVVVNSIAKAARTIDLTQRVGNTSQASAVVKSRPNSVDSAAHGVEGDTGVDSQENVVQNDKDLEGASFTDGPWLVSLTSVVRVDGEHSDDIGSRNGDGNLYVQGAVVDIEVDREGRLPSGLVGGRRESSGQMMRRELEERSVGEGEMDRRARHGGGEAHATRRVNDGLRGSERR
jgi:hypothetical protein